MTTLCSCSLSILHFWDSSVQFSCSVMSDSFQPHGLQHARPPCPSPTPRDYKNSCPSGRWCHSTISYSVGPSPPAFNFPRISSSCSSVAHSCLTLCDPMNCSTPSLLSITNSRSSLKLMSTESVMPSSHLILCRPLLLPPISPSKLKWSLI